jgi:hypothetical protein
MKGKQPIFIFALKRNEKYGSETKMQERNEAKRKICAAKRSENIYAIFCF